MKIEKTIGEKILNFLGQLFAPSAYRTNDLEEYKKFTPKKKTLTKKKKVTTSKRKKTTHK